MNKETTFDPADQVKHYLALMDQMIQRSTLFDDPERQRLSRAAAAMQDAADAALDEAAVRSGYLEKAVELLRPALTEHLSSAAVASAETYVLSARTWSRRHSPVRR